MFFTGMHLIGDQVKPLLVFGEVYTLYFKITGSELFFSTGREVDRVQMRITGGF
ncbi:hypothetical protein D9M70_645910 [compost metagenome]